MELESLDGMEPGLAVGDGWQDEDLAAMPLDLGLCLSPDAFLLDEAENQQDVGNKRRASLSAAKDVSGRGRQLDALRANSPSPFSTPGGRRRTRRSLGARGAFSSAKEQIDLLEEDKRQLERQVSKLKLSLALSESDNVALREPSCDEQWPALEAAGSPQLQFRSPMLAPMGSQCLVESPEYSDLRPGGRQVAERHVLSSCFAVDRATTAAAAAAAAAAAVTAAEAADTGAASPLLFPSSAIPSSSPGMAAGGAVPSPPRPPRSGRKVLQQHRTEPATQLEPSRAWAGLYRELAASESFRRAGSGRSALDQLSAECRRDLVRRYCDILEAVRRGESNC